MLELTTGSKTSFMQKQYWHVGNDVIALTDGNLCRFRRRHVFFLTRKTVSGLCLCDPRSRFFFLNYVKEKHS